MQKILSEQSKLLSGRALVVKSTLPSAPVELSLNPQLEILQDFQILLQPGTLLVKDFGFRVLDGNGVLIFPAMGSNDSGTGFVSENSGWGAIPTGNVLQSGPLNVILSGSPYNVRFQFYNADAATDGYIFIWARVTSKIDLPQAPIQADAKEK